MACHFSVPFSGEVAEIVSKARSGIGKAGGNFNGDNNTGAFDISTMAGEVRGTYTVNGSVRPTHDNGRAWDGGKDVRSDGVSNYTVGIEWEYVNDGYGIVRLDGYVSPRAMTGLVISPFPASTVGTPSAATTWTFSGNAVTKVFSVVGAVSPSTGDYSVTIGGVGVQP